MAHYIDEQFANVVGRQLEKFKLLNRRPYTADFRCPICGDSQKNKNKKRGYFYTLKNSIAMKCHNCQASMSLSSFLKEVDIALHKEYIFDRFKFNNDYRWNSKRVESSEDRVDAALKKKTQKIRFSCLEGIAQMNILKARYPNHEAVKYLEERKMPKNLYKHLYYSENFQKWVNHHVKVGKFDPKYMPDRDPRIVIPFFDKMGRVFAYQGRSIDKNNKQRYITINETDSPLVYGLDRADKDRPLYIVEGPIDSLFIENSIAVAGSALKKLLKVKNDNFVYVFDNEPRSEIICGLMENIIQSGKQIVIWPPSYEFEFKDINDLVMQGESLGVIECLLTRRTMSGIEAKLNFSKWKKI